MIFGRHNFMNGPKKWFGFSISNKYIPKVVEFPNKIWETKRIDGYARWKLKLHGYIYKNICFYED